MTENRTVARLRSQFPAAIVAIAGSDDDTTVTITREALVPVCRFLHDDPDLAYVFLVDLTAVDYLEHPRKRERFAVTYLLHSYQNNERLRLTVWVPKDNPVMPTVTGIWKGANWLEREVYDLMGITFTDHPDMRRIIMPSDFDGHPLRKDFPVFGKEDPVVRVKGSRQGFDQ